MTVKIATANRLSDGLVLYLGPAGWIDEIHLARRADTEEAQSALLADALAAVVRNDVADAYLIDFDLDRAVRRRERIRALGPTVRTDLGYQASRSH